MIKIKECRIGKYAPTKFGVNITLQIKEEDIIKQEKDLLEELWKNGDSLVGVLSQFQNERQESEIDITNKLKQRLALTMQNYCEKEGIENEVEIQKLYTRNKVTSRGQLSKMQLEQELSMYEAGLL